MLWEKDPEFYDSKNGARSTTSVNEVSEFFKLFSSNLTGDSMYVFTNKAQSVQRCLNMVTDRKDLLSQRKSPQPAVNENSCYFQNVLFAYWIQQNFTIWCFSCFYLPGNTIFMEWGLLLLLCSPPPCCVNFTLTQLIGTFSHVHWDCPQSRYLTLKI